MKPDQLFSAAGSAAVLALTAVQVAAGAEPTVAVRRSAELWWYRLQTTGNDTYDVDQLAALVREVLS